MSKGQGAWVNFPMDGVDAAVSVRAANLCGRTLGNAPLVRGTQTRDPFSSGLFGFFPVVELRAPAESVVDSVGPRLEWEVIDGKTAVVVRLEAKGFRDPDLREGLAGTARRVILYSAHLWLISLSALNIRGSSMPSSRRAPSNVKLMPPRLWHGAF